jgi:mRNA-degrading endonuclease RelE of RelBE toxin-antitoxin system
LFQITITAVAETQLRSLPVRDQRILEAAVLSRLAHQPTTASRSVKQLRPNPLAEWELRVGDLRILYNVSESEVVLLVVGRKAGNKLIVEGREFHGHRGDSAEPAGGEPGSDAE